jgi:hypothetical protein
MGVLEQIQKELNIPSFSFNAKDTGERLSLQVFNGRLGITLWPPEKSNQKGPVFRQNFTPAGGVMFKKMMREASTMAPNTRKTILFSEWDPDTKKSSVKGALVLGRNEKMEFYFEAQFSFNGNNKSVTFNIMASNSISDSATEFGFPQRSAAQVDAINDWIDTIVPLAIVITSRKQSFDKGGGGVSDSAEY